MTDMADSDSVESTSGAEFDGRLRSVGRDVINRMATDKQIMIKSKLSSDDAPEIGASYLVRRLDSAFRKWDVWLSFRRVTVNSAANSYESEPLITLTLTFWNGFIER